MSKIRIGNVKYLDLDTDRVSRLDIGDSDFEIVTVPYTNHKKSNNVLLNNIYNFVIQDDSGYNFIKETNNKVGELIFNQFMHSSSKEVFDLDYDIFGEYNGWLERFGKVPVHIYNCEKLDMIMVRHSEDGKYQRVFFHKREPEAILDHVSSMCSRMFDKALSFDKKENIKQYRKGKKFHKLFAHTNYWIKHSFRS